ncbi:zinc finger and SCAN domain-containing protein 20-like [Entelurus aequoreus]|uniref:zinc finger and SCAN domain-containing protein 20-like n=1 Tax=Entelurus aequoreus TaxID=161455 RepID=UPI002B1E1976|nr:zinc finger and SCAN domain-containing protein 20-like [Entelurus aequoreus]
MNSSNMNVAVINSSNMNVASSSVSTTRRKREAERSVNWTVEETQVLLCAWSDERVQKSLSENLRNRHVFKHLSARMSDMGFCRSPHQCRLRVKTLKANYVRAKLQRSAHSSQLCNFKYFQEMDAVLGRRADLSAPDPADRTVGSFVGRYLGSSGIAAEEHFSSSEERGGRQMWPLDFQVKLENEDDSEFSDMGFMQGLGEGPPQGFVGSSIHPEPVAPPVDIVSSPSPAHPPASSPEASTPPGAEGVRPEAVLAHLSRCFRQLVSETRGLLVQLDQQRQDQARWHQDLLSQWAQREERRQREAAEREERREKAHMEHQVRVLELLTSLAREQGGRAQEHKDAK